MAIPPSPPAFAELLRDEGVTVVEVGDWDHHNRNHVGPWGPVHGVMIHHTVTFGTDRTVQICRTGHSTLPGPLCHGVIAKDGRVHLVGYGRANHAGLGDDDVLRAVINEQPLPPDNETSTDGNRHFYGFECENLGNGTDPWPAAQLLAIEKVSAAICRHHGWSARSVIGHLEWQPGKIDPRGFGMGYMRERIAKRLGSPAPGPSLPAPRPPEVSLSKLIKAAKTDPTKSGTPVSYRGVAVVETALVDAGLLAKTRSDGHWGTTTLTAYAKWQKSCGYSGLNADGIPGSNSLRKLGTKYGFRVDA